MSAPRQSRDLPQGALTVVVALVIGFGVFRFLLAIGVPLPFGLSESDDPSRTVFFAFLLMVVLVVLVIALARVRQDHISARWPQAAARILTTGVETRTRHFKNEPESTYELPAVEYEFTVGGQTYRGARVRLDGENAEEDAHTVAARYVVGATVPVFYDPKDPSNCMLERGSAKGLLPGCAVLLAVAIGIVWLGKLVLDLLGRIPGSNPPLVLFAAFFSLMMFAGAYAAKLHVPEDLDDLKQQVPGVILLLVGLGCLFIAVRAAGLLH